MNGIATFDVLSQSAINDSVSEALRPYLNAQRVLVLTTDYSRVDFTAQVFRAVVSALPNAGSLRIDVLNTAGTHRRMTMPEFNRKLGGTRKDYPCLCNRFQHLFSSERHIRRVGTLTAEFMSQRTEGYLNTELPVTVNKRILDGYDLVICISGTVPHEGTGFSGGTKILFPGIAGEEVIGAFHWAAVLIGIPSLIGERRNAARDIVDAAAALAMKAIAPTPVVSLNMVYVEDDSHRVLPKGLFFGEGPPGFDQALERAAELSAKLHIIELDRPKSVVVQCIPKKYDEWWTAMKGSYKLQRPGVLAPGAKVILLAPHIHCFHSYPLMDQLIRDIGYHGRDYVLEYLRTRPGFSKNIASHVINARGIGEYRDGVENFPFELILASQVPESECRDLGLGYLDPASLRREDFQGSETLWIEQGGQFLYSGRPS